MSLALVAPRRLAAREGAFARFLASRGCAAGLVALAVATQLCGHLNGDNSWLITVDEKILDGARAYVDVIETNPPASFLLYMPAVALARALALAPEFVVALGVFVGAALSLGAVGALLRRTGLVDETQRRFLFNAGLFALLVAPCFCFAEREHVAAILFLPSLAVTAMRAEGASPRARAAIVAGALAGAAIAIKPHFALVTLFASAYALARRRSLRPLLTPEMFAVGVILLAYAALVWIRFPAFFAVLPMLLDAYVPVTEPLREQLLEPWFLLNAALLAGLGVAAWRKLTAPASVCVAASVGFLAAYFVQAKGYENHGLPGVVMALLAVALTLGPSVAAMAQDSPAANWAALRRFALFVAAPAAIAAPLMFGLVDNLAMREEYPGLTQAVRRYAPPHPSIIAVSPQLDIGHPLTRRLGGVWVGRSHSLWLMACAHMLIEARIGDAERLRRYVEADAEGFAQDVAERRPDVVIIGQGAHIDMLMSQPLIRAALAPYKPVATVSGAAIWTRGAAVPET